MLGIEQLVVVKQKHKWRNKYTKAGINEKARRSGKI